MQLKFRRSNGQKGLIGKSTTYIVDATMMPTAEEDELLRRFEGDKECVWYLADDEMRIPANETKDEVYEQVLRTSFNDLRVGKRFEYSRMYNVRRTERDILDACQALLSRCEYLSTFDGTERVVELTSDEAGIVAEG